jgi:hypothetical protein
MSLQSWLENGWLRQHRTSKKEIADLFRIMERDLQDAEGGISDDWRFGIAYNAALKLCTILLYAEGFRPERTLQHIGRSGHCRSSLAKIEKPMRIISTLAVPNATQLSTTLSARQRAMMFGNWSSLSRI